MNISINWLECAFCKSEIRKGDGELAFRREFQMRQLSYHKFCLDRLDSVSGFEKLGPDDM